MELVEHARKRTPAIQRVIRRQDCDIDFISRPLVRP